MPAASPARFPILGTGESIPWSVIWPHEQQALVNHGQTLTVLSRRGGLDWVEALFVLTDRSWRGLDDGRDVKDAKAQVLAICERNGIAK